MYQERTISAVNANASNGSSFFDYPSIAAHPNAGPITSQNPNTPSAGRLSGNVSLH